VPEQFQSTEYTRFLCPVYSFKLNLAKCTSFGSGWSLGCISRSNLY